MSYANKWVTETWRIICIYPGIILDLFAFMTQTTLGTMGSEVLIILIVGVATEFVVGVALNLSILVVYIGNLKNGLSLGSSDTVHLTKALVNIALHIMIMTQLTVFAYWSHLLLVNDFSLWMLMINMFLNFYSYWLTALLCIYYCTNITTCGHHVFVWLKRSLSSYLLHIILVSGLGSVAICIPVFWYCNMEPAENTTYQSTVIQGTFFKNPTYKTTVFILGCFLPFAIAFVSTIFTSWSLINHMWRIKQKNWGFTCSKFRAQINATRTMVLFLLIYLVYSVAQMFFIVIISFASDAIMIALWFIVLSFPISEAVIIIQSSSKLRNTLLKFFDKKIGNNEPEM